MKKKIPKRLPRTARGTLILPNGDKITPREQRALRSAVNSANRRRKKALERLGNKVKYNMFGQESDFVNRKKSAKFNVFRSHKEFRKYLHSVRDIASGAFELRRIKTYKENYITALKRTFGSDAKEAIKLVRDMDIIKFRNKVENDEIPELGYIYFDPNNSKLAEIEALLSV